MLKTVQNRSLYAIKSSFQYLKRILADKLEALIMTPKMDDFGSRNERL